MKINFSDRRLWLLVFAAIFLFHLLTLMRYPPPFVDEGSLVSRAWAFKSTGHQVGMLDSGLGEQFAGFWTLNQWLITALQSLVLRFFAQPELLPMRILSLIEGFGLLAVTYWTAARLSGKPVALISTLLLAVSRIFIHTAHMARYDILATFLGYSALALVVNDRRSRLWVGLIAGVLAGLAVETHLNSLIFLPAIGVYLLIEYRGRVFRKPGAWGFVIGTAIGAVIFLSLHILPYPDTYFKVNALLFSKTQAPPILSGNLSRILEGFTDAGFLLLLGSGPMLLLGALAVPLLVRRKTSSGWELLAINIAFWLGAALLFPNSMGHYAIYLAPGFMWLVADFLVDFFHRPWQSKLWNYAYFAMVLGVVAGSLALTVELLIPNGYESYQRAQTQINGTVLPGDKVIGPQVYWLGLYNHQYYSWELLFMYSRFYKGKTLEDAVEYFRPDILILDGNNQPYISDNVDPGDRWYDYRVSRKELFDYLDRHAQRVSLPEEVTYYGSPVLVYRLIWDP